MIYSSLYNKVSNFLTANPTANVNELTIPDREIYVEAHRIIQYRKFWHAWNNHVNYIRQGGASPTVQINISRAFVDRITDFLLANPFSAQVVFQKYNSIVAPVLDYITKRGNIHLSMQETLTTGSVCGDAVIKVVWDELLKSPRFQCLDPGNCFFEYATLDKAKTNLTKAVIVWEGYYDWGGKRAKKWVLFKEEWTNERVRRGIEYVKEDKTGQTQAQGTQGFSRQWLKTIFAGGIRTPVTELDWAVEEISDEENSLGFIPVVHFRNQIVPFQVYGRSDLSDLTYINQALNEAVNQYRDAVNYHGNPITLIYGAKAGNLKKGANKIWSGLPKDSKVENLGGNEEFPAIQRLMELLQDFAYMVASVPETASGLFQNISNTTGVALQVQYLPLLNLAARKQLTYGPALAQAYEYALRIMDAQMSLGLQKQAEDYAKMVDELNQGVGIAPAQMQAADGASPDGKMNTPKIVPDIETAPEKFAKDFVNKLIPQPSAYEVQIRWGDPLPKDRLILLNELERAHDLGVQSVRGAMLELGITDPDAKLKEIREEKLLGITSVAGPKESEEELFDDDFTPDNKEPEDESGNGEAEKQEVSEQKSEEQQSGNNLGTKQKKRK